MRQAAKLQHSVAVARRDARGCLSLVVSNGAPRAGDGVVGGMGACPLSNVYTNIRNVLSIIKYKNYLYISVQSSIQ